MNKSDRFKILIRDNFKCGYCGKTSENSVLEVDHIIPQCQGGSDAFENLITSCLDCNRGKSGMILPDPDNANLELSEKLKKAEACFELKFKIDNKTQVFNSPATMLALYYGLKSKNAHNFPSDFSKRILHTMQSAIIAGHHPWIIYKSIDFVLENYVPKMPNINNYRHSLSVFEQVCEKLGKNS